MSIQHTVKTFTATVKGIDVKTGQERYFTSTVTLKGSNLRARAEKALRSNILNQRPWMLLEPIQYQEVGR